MQKKGTGRLSGSQKGQMPFAIIAVTLLLLGSAYGIVSSQIEDTEKHSENVESELNAIGRSIEETERFIERGLGEIIYDISVDADAGTLSDRAKAFVTKAEDWIGFQFPTSNGAVSVSVKDFKCDLTAESLKMTSDDRISGGYSPTYLKCTGEFTGEYVSDSGSSVRTTLIDTDGTCALPLAVEQNSVFSNSVTGSGSLLSQMMTYQLSALAQYRVINGYGALSAYGDMGTESILTEKDVLNAYRNSLRALELISFRTSSDGEVFGSERLDLADCLISEDGKIEIDISAIYSQSLISIMDDATMKWFDYFYGNRILNAADMISDNLKNAWDSLKGFFTGKDEFSAVPYIENVMASNNIDRSEYRYPLAGMGFTVAVPYTVIPVNVSGISDSLKIDAFEISIPYPDTDLMDMKELTDFKKHYRSDTNEIREWFRSIINTAAFEIGQSKAFGTIRFDVDEADDEAFMETVSKTVRSALEDGDRIFEGIMTSAISGQSIPDPFCASIYRTMEEGSGNHLESFNAFTEDRIRSAVTSSIHSAYGTVLDPYAVSELTDRIMSGNDVTAASDAYMAAISKCVEKMGAIRDVPNGKDGPIKDICTEIFKKGAIFADALTDVPQRIAGMCAEIENNMSVNTYYGLTDIPSEGGFSLTDGNGDTSVEILKLSATGSPVLNIGSPNSNLSDCVHQVGFKDESGASYCTVFTVDLKDDLNYVISSTGGLASVAGMNDSEFKDTTSVNLKLKITVASGWGLAGVRDYRASNTILEDAWNVLVDLLSPILEPLRKIMSMIMDSLAILGSALMEIAKYVSSVIEKLYSALIEPLEQLRLLIEEKLDGLIDSALESAIDAVQWIVGADLSKQTVGFSFMGFTLTFTTKLATLINNTKTLFTVTLGCDFDRLAIEGSLTVKQKGSAENRELIMTGSATITGEDWRIHANIDPTMKSSKHMITMDGTVKGVAFDITMPELKQYEEMSLTLSDVPGLSSVLSNIPVPIPGMKAAIDAGVVLKYNLPVRQCVVINEFEPNPPGTDSGNEWVEIYNATSESVDLNGYTLQAGSDPKRKTHTIADTELGPRERVVIVFPGAFLNNSKENVILKDTDGNEIDKTPKKSDSYNDGRTWQRTTDASTEWTFSEGTQDSENGGRLPGSGIMKTQMIGILKDAAKKTMDDMGDLKNLTDLSDFFEKMMQSAITSGIEAIASCIIEASIFASLELRDASSTGCTGLRIALSVDSQFVEDGLKCIVGELESILMNIENPYGLEPKTVFTDNMYLNVTVYTGMATPGMLKNASDYPKVKLGVQIGTNVSGLCRILGHEEGTWSVSAGVVILDCPSEIIPSALGVDKAMSSDLWLIKATFGPAKAAQS